MRLCCYVHVSCLPLSKVVSNSLACVNKKAISRMNEASGKSFVCV